MGKVARDPGCEEPGPGPGWGAARGPSQPASLRTQPPSPLGGQASGVPKDLADCAPRGTGLSRGEGTASERLEEGTCLLTGLEVGGGRVWRRRSPGEDAGFFLSLPVFRKGTTLRGGTKAECKHKQPQKEAKKS